MACKHTFSRGYTLKVSLFSEEGRLKLFFLSESSDRYWWSILVYQLEKVCLQGGRATSDFTPGGGRSSRIGRGNEGFSKHEHASPFLPGFHFGIPCVSESGWKGCVYTQPFHSLSETYGTMYDFTNCAILAYNKHNNATNAKVHLQHCTMRAIALVCSGII